MRSGRSLLCADTENDERVDAAFSSSRGVRSIIAGPLLHAGLAVGLLLLYGEEAGAFGEGELTTMELLSVILSGAMAHAAEFEGKRDQVQALARFEATFADDLTGMVLLDLDGAVIDSKTRPSSAFWDTPTRSLPATSSPGLFIRETVARRARPTSGWSLPAGTRCACSIASSVGRAGSSGSTRRPRSCTTPPVRRASRSR